MANTVRITSTTVQVGENFSTDNRYLKISSVGRIGLGHGSTLTFTLSSHDDNTRSGNNRTCAGKASIPGFLTLEYSIPLQNATISFPDKVARAPDPDVTLTRVTF